MDDDYETATLFSVAEFAQLDELALDVKAVTIADIREGFELPLMPAHVKLLTLSDVHLVGPVAFTEGLIEMYLTFTSEVPLNEWQWPVSLQYISIAHTHIPVIDLRESGVAEVALSRSLTPVDQVFLPEGLSKLMLFRQNYRELPRLPPTLTFLSIARCLELTDLSRARDVAITELATDAVFPLYENFAELTKLTLSRLVDSMPEISLTHLRKLRFIRCRVTDPIEVNAPNLESLILWSGGPLNLQGSFAENVTRLRLLNYGAFPTDGDWSHLEELIVDSMLADNVIDVPELPWLRRLTVDHALRTNGVMVTTLREYKQAWNSLRRKKRAVHA